MSLSFLSFALISALTQAIDLQSGSNHIDYISTAFQSLLIAGSVCAAWKSAEHMIMRKVDERRLIFADSGALGGAEDAG